MQSSTCGPRISVGEPLKKVTLKITQKAVIISIRISYFISICINGSCTDKPTTTLKAHVPAKSINYEWKYAFQAIGSVAN